MARSLAHYRIDDGLQAQRQAASRRVDRSAAMAFGAAIASLLVSTIVVNQSSSALEPQGAIAGNSFQVGTIALSDDDEGQSLVNLANMVPGHPAQECIELTYDGTLLPVGVTLTAVADGELARYVDVEIDTAQAGGFGRCDQLVDAEPLYRGSLADLAQGEPLTVATYRNNGEHTSFRFHFELRDDAGAIGQATTADFRWEAVPL